MLSQGKMSNVWVHTSSNPEWFDVFANQLMEHQEAGVRSHADQIAGQIVFES